MIDKVKIKQSNCFINLFIDDKGAIALFNTIYISNYNTFILLKYGLDDIIDEKENFDITEKYVNLLGHELYHVKDYNVRNIFEIVIDWFKGLPTKYKHAKPLEEMPMWFGKYIATKLKPKDLKFFFDNYPLPDAKDKRNHIYDWLDAHDIFYGGLRYTKKSEK